MYGICGRANLEDLGLRNPDLQLAIVEEYEIDDGKFYSLYYVNNVIGYNIYVPNDDSLEIEKEQIELPKNEYKEFMESHGFKVSI